MTRAHKNGLWLIIISALVELVFDLIPNQGPRVKWFAWTGHDFTPATPQWDGMLYVATIIYYACEHLAIVGRFVAAAWIPTKRIFMILAGIEFLDLIDYAITYNQPWVVLDQLFVGFPVPIEFSLFKTLGIIIFVQRQFRIYGHNSDVI